MTTETCATCQHAIQPEDSPLDRTYLHCARGHPTLQAITVNAWWIYSGGKCRHAPSQWAPK